MLIQKFWSQNFNLNQLRVQYCYTIDSKKLNEKSIPNKYWTILTN